MQFIIADTFQDSLARLDNRFQAPVNQSVIDFLKNPAQPGKKFHRLNRCRDKNFWSFRVNDDIRIIVYKTDNLFVLSYVDHHDPAYAWAKDRRMEAHPKTGAIQLVKVIEEEVVQRIVRQEYMDPPIFARFDRDYLHALGVPESWLHPIMHVTEEQFLDIYDELPAEAAERLLKLASGEIVPVPERVHVADAFSHPDTRRRFQVVENQAALQRALDWPWERWTVFLHPLQQQAVEANYKGPAYISGGAGTGKTVVALHRAKRLLQQDPNCRLLFTTYSKTLARQLVSSAEILMDDDPSLLERMTITNLHALMARLYREHRHRFIALNDKELPELFERALSQTGHSFDLDFLQAEWNAIIDPWGLSTWEEYRDFSRRGRGTPLDARSRSRAWEVFEHVQKTLRAKNRMTWNQLSYECIRIVKDNPELQWDHIVVDESQDLGPAELRLLRALAQKGPQDLFLVGDRGQQLYQRPFSWRRVGINVVGRSTNLIINYRTTQEIRRFADNLLPPTIEEHGNQEISRRTISLLNGQNPEIRGFDDQESEAAFVENYLRELLKAGLSPRDIAIFGRTRKLINRRIKPLLDRLSLPVHSLREESDQLPDAISIGTMHAAKGLEFKVVILIGCERDTIPYKSVIQNSLGGTELQERLTQERNLLYVAATRAREQVLLTYIGKPSTFLNRAAKALKSSGTAPVPI